MYRRKMNIEEQTMNGAIPMDCTEDGAIPASGYLNLDTTDGAIPMDCTEDGAIPMDCTEDEPQVAI